MLIRILLHMPIAVLCADKYSRYDFPPGFVFGSATAAYQVSLVVGLCLRFTHASRSLSKNHFPKQILYLNTKDKLMKTDELLVTHGRWREQQAKMGGLLAFGILLPTLVSFFS